MESEEPALVKSAPAAKGRSRKAARDQQDVFDRILEFREKLRAEGVGPFSHEEILSWRDEGRGLSE